MSKWSSAFRDSRWQEIRLRVMERDGFKCRSCGKSGEGVTLNVHHTYYETGKAPWEYDNSTLVTWCEECHAFRHKAQNAMLLDIVDQKIDVVAGLVNVCSNLPETIKALSSASGVIDDCKLASIIWTIMEAYQTGFDTCGQLHDVGDK